VVAPHPLIEYHELLEDVDLAAESAAALSDGQRARRLVFGDRPLCVALRPNLISRWQYDAITKASETLYAAFDRLEQALLKDDDLRLELDLDPREAELALADPGFRAGADRRADLRGAVLRPRRLERGAASHLHPRPGLRARQAPLNTHLNDKERLT
jgi:hypothetical protein